MTYALFKKAIQAGLRKHPEGRTWKELRDGLALPYSRPCPEWTKALELEIGLVRGKGSGRELIWSLAKRG